MLAHIAYRHVDTMYNVIQIIKMNYKWAQISYSSRYQAHLKNKK